MEGSASADMPCDGAQLVAPRRDASGKSSKNGDQSFTPGLILPIGLVAVQYGVTKQVWGPEWRTMQDPFGNGCSVMAPLIASVLYLSLVFVGQRLMRGREPLDAFCRPYMLVYNLYQTVFNAWWVFETIRVVVGLGQPFLGVPLTKGPEQFELGLLIWLHYQNKYIEMLDTTFMVLRKKTKQVSFLHCYHHLLIMWAWFLVCKFGCGGEAYFGATVNAFIHVLMYSYYFLSTLKITVPWKKHLTMMQMTQFCICFAQAVYAGYSGMYPPWLCCVQIWVMLNMLYLFNQFYKKNYAAKKAAEKIARLSRAPAKTTAKMSFGDRKDRSNSRKKRRDPQKPVLFINGVKYDVKDFAPRHPGGRVINFYLEQDATDVFNAFHRSSPEAKRALKALPRTNPAPGYEARLASPDAPHTAEFRRLFRKWNEEGLFRPNYLVVLLRFAEIFGGLALAVWMVRQGSSIVLSGAVAGYAWTKAGFLQHDAGHLAITGVTWADTLFQCVVEGLAKGGSPSWWRYRHNKHHARPNVHGHDSDLFTLPFLSWDEKHARKAPKWLIRYQAYYFLPLLFLYVPIFFITTKLFVWRRRRPLDALFIALHFAVFLPLLTPVLSPAQIFAWYMVGYGVQGLYLGFVFSLSHFAMPHIHEHSEADAMDWVKHQVATTLDFSESRLVGWLTGHLNLQIEHHLVPSMPSDNLPLISADVRRMCKDNGINATYMSTWDAIRLNFATLDSVAKAACAPSA